MLSKIPIALSSHILQDMILIILIEVLYSLPGINAKVILQDAAWAVASRYHAATLTSVFTSHSLMAYIAPHCHAKSSIVYITASNILGMIYFSLGLLASDASASITQASHFSRCHGQSSPSPLPIDSLVNWLSRDGEYIIQYIHVSRLPMDKILHWWMYVNTMTLFHSSAGISRGEFDFYYYNFSPFAPICITSNTAFHLFSHLYYGFYITFIDIILIGIIASTSSWWLLLFASNFPRGLGL